MSKKLFVAGIAYSVADEQLANHFSKVGTVVSAKVIMDSATGRSKGFGFVEMETEEQASAAMKELDGTEIEGRAIVVKEAKPQVPRNQGNYGR